MAWTRAWRGVDFSVNGNSYTNNLVLVDGVNNNDVGSNRTILVYRSRDQSGPALEEKRVSRGLAVGDLFNDGKHGCGHQRYRRRADDPAKSRLARVSL